MTVLELAQLEGKARFNGKRDVVFPSPGTQDYLINLAIRSEHITANATDEDRQAFRIGYVQGWEEAGGKKGKPKPKKGVSLPRPAKQGEHS